MPYIKKVDREKFEKGLSMLPYFENKGELEYVVFALMMKYMSTHEYRYSDLHDCTYAVIHAGEEFKRRYLDKREDQAINDNGDIK